MVSSLSQNRTSPSISGDDEYVKTTNKEFSLKLTYKEEIDRCTSSSNIIIRFYPHQSNPLGLGSKYDPYFTK
ncbi:unnamed protein product [marine sediment metagenome]|uniref:Uncharacterized protein n=1 Tax=marine sediment metagenome TaxID=412755 RepID=X0U475_9ZZZZ